MHQNSKLPHIQTLTDAKKNKNTNTNYQSYHEKEN